MASASKIEWTEQSWNPVTGCTKVSLGCKNCYAEVMAKRLQAMDVPGYENGFEVTMMPDRLSQPLERQKPTVYFVNSMSDLFHEKVTVEFIDRVFDTIWKSPQHIYQILTKRAERMAEYCENHQVPSNAWMGVSVEDRKHGLPRIYELRKINCTIRFISAEPLLEDLGKINLTGIHWVIVGGESGQNARPMNKEWAVNIQKQCLEKNIAFFFKQWGGWGSDGVKRHKKANGKVLQGKVWNEMPYVGV